MVIGRDVYGSVIIRNKESKVPEISEEGILINGEFNTIQIRNGTITINNSTFPWPFENDIKTITFGSYSGKFTGILTDIYVNNRYFFHRK